MRALPTKSEGEGPPLALLPLSLASSQWDPLLARLSTRCRTITLGGPELGFLAMLESRGRSAGYLNAVKRMMDAAARRGRPGSRLWVGRAGSLARPVYKGQPHYRRRRQSISPPRGQGSRAQQGLADVIAFQEGNAEALPFPDNHVNVALSFTVLEEGNADRMLAELVRITKPGGRVAVMVRAIDIPLVVNVPLHSELKTKVQTPHGFVGAEGCADASLYRRFHRIGLTHVRIWPQFATFEEPHTPQAQFAHGAILGALTDDETQEWHAGMAETVTDGTYFIAQPFHCAVGTKPKTA